MPLNDATLQALARFPEQLEAFYDAIPQDFKAWAPDSWDGIPSETFTALEQICHVRDIEIDGYQDRLRRILSETGPFLPSLDGYALAKERLYATADSAAAIAAIHGARAETIEMIADLDDAQLGRVATFEGYGPVTTASLIYYLCSHDQQHLSGLQWLLGKIAIVEAGPSPNDVRLGKLAGCLPTIPSPI